MRGGIIDVIVAAEILYEKDLCANRQCGALAELAQKCLVLESKAQSLENERDSVERRMESLTLEYLVRDAYAREMWQKCAVLEIRLREAMKRRRMLNLPAVR